MQAPYRSKEIQCHGKLSFVVVVKCNIERKNKVRMLLDYEGKKKKKKRKWNKIIACYSESSQRVKDLGKRIQGWYYYIRKY